MMLFYLFQSCNEADKSTPSDENLESINTQLSELQGMIAGLTKTASPILHQSVPQPLGSVPSRASSSKPSPIHAEEATSSTIPYLGESSFEVHSQQTSQILEKALGNTPPSNSHHDEGSSAWQSIRELLKEKTRPPPKSFTHELPMVPIQTALRALRLIDGVYQLSIVRLFY